MTPTARSLTHLRRLGWTVEIVERWLPHANVRRDCFGFADLLAVHARDGVFLLVQSTTASHVAHRLQKAKQRPELAAWLRAGGLFHVHGWLKRGDRWEVRIVEVQADDLVDVVLQAPRHRRRRKNERQRDFFDARSPA